VTCDATSCERNTPAVASSLETPRYDGGAALSSSHRASATMVAQSSLLDDLARGLVEGDAHGTLRKLFPVDRAPRDREQGLCASARRRGRRPRAPCARRVRRADEGEVRADLIRAQHHARPGRPPPSRRWQAGASRAPPSARAGWGARCQACRSVCGRATCASFCPAPDEVQASACSSRSSPRTFTVLSNER